VAGDLRQASRALRNAPYAVLGAVVTLALGLGATTAIFTLLDTVLLRPLDVRDPERIVRFFDQRPGRASDPGFLYSQWRDRRELNSFDKVAAYGMAGFLPTLLELGDRLLTVEALAVSSNYFEVLGVPMALGSGITPEDEVRGAPAVAIISDRAWRVFFAAAPDVVGKVVRLNQTPITIVGVAPPGSHRPELRPSPAFFVSMRAVPLLTAFPMTFFDTEPDARSSPIRHWRLLGRLKEGISISQAEAEVDAQDRVRQSAGSVAPDQIRKTAMLLPLTVAALPLTTRADTTRFLWLLTGTVALLLLLACMSVAGLLLARFTQRRRELAVRIALGAGKGRLVRLALAESALVAAGGGAAGLLVSHYLLQSLGSFWLPGAVSVETLRLAPDVRILFFVLLISFATAAVCALGPAGQATRTDVVEHLSSRPGSTAHGRSHTQPVLVIVQVAVALVLLVGAGLFGRSVERVLSRDVGFPGDQVLVASVTTTPQRYPQERAEALIVDAAARIRQLSGVEGVGLGPRPLGMSHGAPSIRIDGQEVRMPMGEVFGVDLVGPGYLTALGVSILAGRDIVESDVGGPLVAVVNEGFARQFWPDANPFGRVFTLLPFQKSITIVGIAKDARWADVRSGPTPCVYIPRSGAPPGYASLPSLIVRTASHTPLVRARVARELSRLFPDMPAPVVETIREGLASWLQPQRLALALFGWFGLIGATIGVVGVSALVASGIAQRTREIAIRSALGGSRAHIHALMAKRGLGPLIFGCVLGLLGAFFARGALRAFLVDLDPLDLPSFLGAAATLLVVALIVVGFVARRALVVDPMQALRTE
jgi:predicted permease